MVHLTRFGDCRQDRRRHGGERKDQGRRLWSFRAGFLRKVVNQTALVLSAPGPAPRSAPVVGLTSVLDLVRSARLLIAAISVVESVAIASPLPPSTAPWSGRWSTYSHSSP